MRRVRRRVHRAVRRPGASLAAAGAVVIVLTSISTHCIVFSRDGRCSWMRSSRAFGSKVRLHEGLSSLQSDLGSAIATHTLLSSVPHSDVQWVHESSFRDDLIGLVDQASYTVFHTDDDVLFRSFPPPAPLTTKCASALGLV